MDIFRILDPDPHENLFRSETLIRGHRPIKMYRTKNLKDQKLSRFDSGQPENIDIG